MGAEMVSMKAILFMYRRLSRIWIYRAGAGVIVLRSRDLVFTALSRFRDWNC